MKSIKYLLSAALVCLAIVSCKNEPTPKPDPGTDPPGEVPAAPFKKGVNLSDWFLADSPESIGKTVYSASDFADIKSLGVDVVRLPIRFHKMTGAAPDYTIPEVFFEKLDYAMDLAEEAQISMILDFHSYFGSTPFPRDYGEAQLTKAWEQVAAHCKDRSTHIYYEIMNEPDGDYLRNAWPAIQGRVLAAIRTVDTKHTVIVGGSDANSYKTLADLPEYEDDNLIYTFHFYEPFLFTHQGQDWSTPSWAEITGVPFPYNASKMPSCPESLKNAGSGEWKVSTLFDNYPTAGTANAVKNSIDVAINFAKERNVKIFCGEFGAMMGGAVNEDRCAYYKVVREYFEANNIAWTMWDYHNSFGLYVRNTNNFNSDLNVPLLEALGFTVPASYGGDDYDEHALLFYGDEVGSNSFANWASTVNPAYTTSTYKGAKAISWKPTATYGSMTFEVWPVWDMGYQAGNNYYLQFAVKSADDVRFMVRFVDYIEGEALWRVASTVRPYENDEANIGNWKLIRVPLSGMAEAWAELNGQWFEPAGNFKWSDINKLEITIEDFEDMVNKQVFLDEIEIVK